MKKKISLKYKIGVSLLVFVVFILLMLFVFQFLLLEPMFEQYKISTVKSVADTVAQNIESDDLNDIIFENQTAYDTCIRVFTNTDSMYQPPNDQIGPGPNSGCILYRMNYSKVDQYITQAMMSDDHTYLVTENEHMIMPTANEDYRNIIYTKVIETDDEGMAVVMVNSGITPMNATTRTLKTQLLFIAGILILAVLVLTYYLYRQIAKPLSVINDSAKSLPEGKYEADETTNRYREAEELNETLVQAARDIQKADHAKRDLIANVSHDLRTPLTMISGYGEMMQDLPDEKTDENLQVIVDEAHRLTNLVNDLLDLSRMQENKIVLKPEVLDLSDLLKTQLKKYEVYTINEGYVIEQNLTDSVLISADRKRLEQVFNNFMTNAINYSGDKKHIIVSETVSGGKVRVEIRDFGEGIAPEDLKNIWDRYYKVDKQHVRVSNGSGIGLSIVREILELHHAEYGVSSELGEGSTFWFEFPIVKAG